MYLTEIIHSGSQMFVVCEGLRTRSRTSSQPVVPYTHTRHRFKITLPNTDQAQENHLWTTTNILSQVYLYNPWWWIAYDPKHVGV